MLKIIILFGGSSYEHEISIISAITLKNNLKKISFSFIFCDINNKFYLISSDNMKSTYFANKSYLKSNRIFISENYFYSKSIFGKKKISGVVLNLIHGRYGEDGKIASILEFFKFLYISPRVDASTISYNKLYTKLYAKNLNIKTLAFTLLNKNEKRILRMEYPVIIKPLHLGSSIGISIVKSKEELDYALDTAFEFDTDILIEPFISNVLEYNLAGYQGKEWEFSKIEEPKKKEMLTFNEKYLDFSRNNKIEEANISKEIKKSIKENFKKIYANLFRGSIIRCDFFVIDSEVYLNEINPIPGSMAHYLFNDFEKTLENISNNLPKEQNIKIDYKYINIIKNNK